MKTKPDTNTAEERPLLSKKQIEQLYRSYRLPFMGYIKKHYRLADDVSQDVFHDSFIVMISNIKAGKFKKQDASLFTYLLGIAKKLVLRRLHKPSQQRLPADWACNQLSDREWTRALDEACRLMAEDDTVCTRILYKFYWEGCSLAEIADEMGYKSADVVKSKKSTCLRRFSFELGNRLRTLEISFRIKHKKH